MAYTDPTTINMTNPINMIYYINNNSNQIFGMGLLISIWLIVFIGYIKAKDDFIGALSISLFVTWILTLLAWLGNITPSYFFGIITGLTIISGLILFGDRGNS